MKSNFNENKFRQIFQDKKYYIDPEKKKLLDELDTKLSSNGTFKSGIGLDARSECIKAHFEKILEAFINSLIESFGEETITSDDERKANKVLKDFTDNYIESEKNGLKSAMLSRGFQVGSIIDGAQLGIVSKLSSVKYHFNNKLKLAVDLHNERLIKKSKASKMLNNKLTDNYNAWELIEEKYKTNKRTFGKKINFIRDKETRKIIFRDTEHAVMLLQNGFDKEAVIIAGTVIEEILRQLLLNKGITPKQNKFDEYVKSCEANKLIGQTDIRLSDISRQFRNAIHIENEVKNKLKINKPHAQNVVASLFIIVQGLKK